MIEKKGKSMLDVSNGMAVKFVMLAEKRVSKALNIIQMIGKLSGRNTYNYSPKQVAKMFAAMRSALDAAEAKFQPEIASRRELSFRLDD